MTRKGPQKIRILLRRALKRNSKKKMRKKKKNIYWEEEKDILQQFLRQKYPLSNSKISKIIEEKAKKNT